MENSHYCEELSDAENFLASTEITISKWDDGKWWLYLFDGDGVNTPINYCPFCGNKFS